ncbi:Fatty acid desaturase domain containing protein [Naviculisporaceae sp. PSN 640]
MGGGLEIRDELLGNNDVKPPQHIDLYGNPYSVPDFTMKQIHDAIPRHCFKPSTTKSLAYMARDYIYLISLIYLSHTYIPLLPSPYFRGALYTIYTFLAGLPMTGIWILAHESGHGALFPKSLKRLNNITGFILHSSLLVPYYSWRISHNHHHKTIGHLQRSSVFAPSTREEYIRSTLGKDVDPVTVHELGEDTPLYTLGQCLVHQLLGWPLYLLYNVSGVTGQRGFPYYSHFWFGESSKLFKRHELWWVFVSDLGLAGMCGLLWWAVRTWGVWNVAVMYGVPYLWVNHWLVVITYLQHTDGKLAYFAHPQWTFARGASATIDRDFGFTDRHFFHNIIGTHVLHHLVSTIPFYHAQEATEAIKKVMGKHYHADTETPLLTAFWKNQRDCKFVEETVGMEGSGIYMFRNLHGRGERARDLRPKEDRS